MYKPGPVDIDKVLEIEKIHKPYERLLNTYTKR